LEVQVDFETGLDSSDEPPVTFLTSQPAGVPAKSAPAARGVGSAPAAAPTPVAPPVREQVGELKRANAQEARPAPTAAVAPASSGGPAAASAAHKGPDPAVAAASAAAAKPSARRESGELQEVSEVDVVALDDKPKAVPPPTPKRKPSAKRGAEEDRRRAEARLATTDRPRARPWWEEIFTDDFVRSMDRLRIEVVRREVQFIEESLAVQKGGIMLDLGCGAGQHAVELASRGYSVVGYDLSLTMLAQAADEAQERSQKLNLLQGDMREMAFEEMFDGVYSWGTSFGYFDGEKNLDVLRRVHRSLRQGGMFLMDIVNRDYIITRLPSLSWFEGDGCVCMDDANFDSIMSRLNVKRTLMLDDGRTREIEFAIRLFSLHEIGKMLNDVGFRVVEVSGHPATAGVFMGPESPRLITLAERR